MVLLFQDYIFECKFFAKLYLHIFVPLLTTSEISRPEHLWGGQISSPDSAREDYFSTLVSF
ncbi:hypothetical protein T11_14535 [Trichinella zimbabwensis]|uniref:Uncharacterized protein n=1 Tax=Trichinella zimbabwensis TaxID=268475 RepID=A0A0V1I4M0_9BILA|nr:hypothetical protein T11_14535 [Trichinella zimbabwensis]